MTREEDALPTQPASSPVSAAANQRSDAADPTHLVVVLDGCDFIGRLEVSKAPRTCAAICARLPFTNSVIQARWSGEAAWIPLGGLDLGVGEENATSRPLPGQILLYPGGLSEAEILVPYGVSEFRCKAGVLRGNHFLTIDSHLDRLADIGEQILWKGAHEIQFKLRPSGA